MRTAAHSPSTQRIEKFLPEGGREMVPVTSLLLSFYPPFDNPSPYLSLSLTLFVNTRYLQGEDPSNVNPKK